jgi:hypothetical protein
MSTQVKYYLARNQKTFGPLTQEEVDALRKSGQLTQYTWMFREGESQWTPIDPPPALPSAAEEPVRQAPARPAPVRQTPVRRIDQHAYRVILFDHRNAISGWLVDASDGGCDIRSDQKGSDPLFVQREIACLTLHDTKTGESIKLRVRVAEIARADRGWTYQLRGNAVPELLERSDQRSETVAA